MGNDLAIEARSLTKSYSDVGVLAGVDVAVRPGSLYALLGPNGAGKTTLVRILATLTRADGGTARVAGFDVGRQRREVRRRISLTGQYAAVDDVQTGAENLRMMGRLAGLSHREARRRATTLLERFELTDVARRRVGHYSGGMRRRLDLAAGLVSTPSVIFLDEPTTGLDLPSRQSMWQVIRELVGTGVTVFMTTQYLEEADLLADRIGVIDGGRIIADGTAAELKAQVAEQRLDVTATDGRSYQNLISALGDRVTWRDPARLALGVPTGGSAGEVRALLDRIDPDLTAVRRFEITAATLDDVFLALTGHAAPTGTEQVGTGKIGTGKIGPQNQKEDVHV